ncbi:hypothetical protein KSF_109980 [Reticulibacter mediterranei]|uniref:Pentapeptide repeat-containing protein n=1 Tax=Reticulibacter mediterranei TaxID=2778369 RepID=A0A8J3J268_9CHLR|nr:pentapeptide repeat-containing protein [Reticulibacter mediterranei]GHP00951.1 hypothetical protein KSF_109980 [Reticulibacter mediterranei]
MRVKLYSWWQQVQRSLARVSGIAIACLLGSGLLLVLILGYWLNWDWTGLGPYIPPIKDGSFQRGKTLWDWLQLLIIPIILAIGGFWLNQVQKIREEGTTQRQAALEREIALDNQRETVLQTYIDKISELLLINNLRNSRENEEVRDIARVRTLTVLTRLDANRKGSVLQFLHESGLIYKDKCIVNLEYANLQKANLSQISLFDADLHEVNLSGANLSESSLRGVELRGANLSGADLSGAHLTEANLYRCNLRDANLSRTSLHRTKLGGIDFHEANLSGLFMLEANLEGADLRHADLHEANLSKAILHGANLTGANLRKANLSKAKFSGSEDQNRGNPEPADLSNTDLSGTDLSNADLRYVTLINANLSKTNLSGADLSEADLKGATSIASEELEKSAKSLKGATMPDGTVHA